MKKIKLMALSALLATTMTISGCGGNGDSAKKDNSKDEVELKWVFLSPGNQKDSKEVWGVFNEKLQNYLPNTTVDFDCITSADYAEKWKLISASQENVDIVWHGWMIPYASEVKKGSYMELDDLIKEVAPDLTKEIPDNILTKSKIDGKLYSIPNMQQMVSYISCLNIPYDTYNKYKDKINPEELQKFFSSHKTMDKELWDKIEEYIVMFKDGGDLYQGVNGFSDFVEKGYEWISNPYKLEIGNEKAVPVNLYLTPEYETFIKVYSDWYKKGYIRKDILTADNIADGKYGLSGGGNYLIGQGYLPTETEIATQKSAGKFPLVKIPFESSHYIPYAAAATNTAISINSKNPQRAMKLIDLVNTEKGKDIYNLLTYGIEGKHYKKVNDIEIEPIGYSTQPTSDSPYGQYKWAIGNTFNAYEIYMKDKNPMYTNKFIKKVNEDAVSSELMGFTLDTDAIKTQLAQVSAVMGEYTKTLNSGATPDVEKTYNEFKEKLKLAGDEKIVAEMKRQIDEYKASKKK